MSSYQGNATLITSKGEYALTDVNLSDWEEKEDTLEGRWNRLFMKGWNGIAKYAGVPTFMSDDEKADGTYEASRIRLDNDAEARVSLTEVEISPHEVASGEFISIVSIDGIGRKPWQD